MGALLVGGSVLAAFFAGAVALFAPCCIVFLFPSYLAAAVKNRRWRLLPLTLMFALGLGTVLVPITVGIGLVASALNRFHTPLYVAGGVLLLGLAGLALIGRSWSLPSFIRSPDPERGDTAGLFSLGVFSGVASSCCAPVLAGVMALSALSSSVAGSVVLGMAYVFGMTFPLFLMALLWDRLRVGERRVLTAHPLTLRVGGRSLSTNTVNVAVAVAFGAMGILVLWLAASGNTTGGPGFQRFLGGLLERGLQRVLEAANPIPEPVLGLALIGLAALFLAAGLRDRRAAATEAGDTSIEGGSTDERENQAAEGDSCHGTAGVQARRGCHEPSEEETSAIR